MSEDWSGPTQVATDDDSTQPSTDGSEARGQPVAPPRIGRFVVLRELGRGGMGVVYVAYDEELDRRVAIKVLSRVHDGAAARMRREAQAMAKLSHPNVAHVYEVGTWQEQIYLAIELIRGSTLSDWAAERERTLDELIAVMVQAGEGLRAAHEAGLVHRDFKPDNVMVGDDGRARVLDFGLAGVDGPQRAASLEDLESRIVELAKSSPLDTPLTVTGTLMGTPAYMSPEQFRSLKAGPASDQFSFCVTLYELVHGERPFAGRDVLSIGVNVTTGKVRKPDDAPTVPAHVREVLDRGLSVEPGDRYPDMAQLLAALRPPLRRRTGFWIGAAAIVAAVAGAGLMAVVGADEAEAPVAEVESPEARRRAIIESSNLPATVSEPLAADPSQTTVHRLDNGLTVYLTPRRHSAQVEATVIVRLDSRAEPRGREGSVALLNRLLFNGSMQLGSTDPEAEAKALSELGSLYEQLDGAGDEQRGEVLASLSELDAKAANLGRSDELKRVLGELDAFAFPRGDGDQIVLYSVLPANRMEQWAAIAAETTRFPSFRDAWGTALRVSHEEAKPTTVRRQWNPYFIPQSPEENLQRRAESLAKLPVHAAKQLHQRYFVPNNTAIALTGDIDWRRARTALEEAFGDWEPEVVLDERETKTAGNIDGRIVVQRPSSVGQRMELIWRTPPRGHTDEPSLIAMDRMFNDPVVGLAAGELEARGRVASATSRYTPGRLGGLWIVDVDLLDSQSPEEAESEVIRVLDRMKRGELESDRFEAAKLALVLDGPLRQAVSHGEAAESFINGIEWKDVVSLPERCFAVTVPDLARVATATLGDDRVVAIARPDMEERSVPVAGIEAPPSPRHAGPYSALAAEILGREVPDLEPQILIEGKDYAVQDTAAGLIISTESTARSRSSTTLRFRRADLSPGVCDSVGLLEHLGSSGLAAMDTSLERYRLGAKLEGSCDTSHVAITLEAPQANQAAAWAGLVRILEDPRLDEERGATHLQKLAEERVRGGHEIKPLLGALRGYAHQGSANPYSRRTPKRRLLAWSDDDLRASYSSLLRARRVTEYTGPVAPQETMAFREREGSELTPVPPPASDRPRPGEVVLVEHESAEDDVFLVVLVEIAIESPREKWNLGLLTDFWKRELPTIKLDRTNEQFQLRAHFPGTSQGDGLEAGTRYVLAFARVAPDACRDEIGRMAAVLNTAPGDEQLAEVLVSREGTMRARRFTDHEIPKTVAAWHLEGAEATDPLQREWRWLKQTSAEDLAPLVEKVRATRPSIIVLAAPGRVDARTLREFGTLRRVPARDVLTP